MPEAIASSAGRYRSFGRAASAAADQMTAMDTSAFVGPEGDQFREKLTSNMPPHLRVTGEAFTKVADALARFASVLTDVQGHLRPVAGQAPQAWQRLQAAKAGLAQAQAADQRHEAAQQQAAAQHQQAVAGARANNQPPPAAPTSDYRSQTPAAQAELSAAQREWDALVHKANGLRAEATAASESCTKAINTAKDMRFAEPPGTWDLLGHAENFITEHKDVLKKISGALKIASAALTVIGLALQAIPVVGNAVGSVLLIAGGIAGGAALAIDAGIYAATGEGSLTTIMIDTALTIIPIGRLAKLGKKAFTLAKSSDEVAAVTDDAAKATDEAAASSDDAAKASDDAASSSTGSYSGGLDKVPKPDPHADAVAKRLGGESRVKFRNDPSGREFDAVSDDYVAQAKPSSVQLGKEFRKQARATFEAAQQTDRSVYYHFDGGSPPESVVRKLNEYSQRYDVPVVIDDTPL